MSKLPDSLEPFGSDLPGTGRFEAALSVYRESGLKFEEMDGSFRTWPDLSPEGKLSHIAHDAAASGVSFDRFAEAARAALAGLDSQTRETAAMRLAFSNQRELFALEAMLPPDGRTERTPIGERFRELLQPDFATFSLSPPQALPSPSAFATGQGLAPGRDLPSERGLEPDAGHGHGRE